MMNLLKYTFSFILLSSVQIIFGQALESPTVFSKINAYYENQKTLDFDMEFTMFKGFYGNNVSENYRGSFYKGKDVSQIRIMDSEIVNFSGVNLIIDTKNKILTYNEISTLTEATSPLNLSILSKYFEEVSRKVDNNLMIIELAPKNKTAQLSYGKIILYLDKVTSAIVKQELFFTNKLPFIDKEGVETFDNGRMLITVHPNQNPSRKIPKLKDYLFYSLTNEIQLAQLYKNYTLVDKSN